MGLLEDLLGGMASGAGRQPAQPAGGNPLIELVLGMLTQGGQGAGGSTGGGLGGMLGGQGGGLGGLEKILSGGQGSGGLGGLESILSGGQAGGGGGGLESILSGAQAGQPSGSSGAGGPGGMGGLLAAIGGIGGLIALFQNAGLGELIQSWIGSGQNHPISGDQLGQVFGPERMGAIAEQLGTSREEAAGQLSEVLPHIIDALTPQGSLPQGGLGSLDSMMSVLQGALGGRR